MWPGLSTECDGCKTVLRPKLGDCCVFWSYADNAARSCTTRASVPIPLRRRDVIRGQPANRCGPQAEHSTPHDMRDPSIRVVHIPHPLACGVVFLGKFSLRQPIDAASARPQWNHS